MGCKWGINWVYDQASQVLEDETQSFPSMILWQLLGISRNSGQLRLSDTYHVNSELSLHFQDDRPHCGTKTIVKMQLSNWSMWVGSSNTWFPQVRSKSDCNSNSSNCSGCITSLLCWHRLCLLNGQHLESFTDACLSISIFCSFPLSRKYAVTCLISEKKWKKSKQKNKKSLRERASKHTCG